MRARRGTRLLFLLAFAPAVSMAAQSCAPVRAPQSVGLTASMEASTDTALNHTIADAYTAYYTRRDHATARQLWLTASETAKTTHNTCAKAMSTFGLGVLATSDDFAQAEPTLQAALELFTQLGSQLGMAHTLRHLNLVADRKGETQKAAEYATRAEANFRAVGDVSGAIQAKMMIEANQNAATLAALVDEAAAHHLVCVQGQVEHTWSDALNPQQNFREAMLHLERSDELLRQCPAFRLSRSSVQISMGRLERQQGRPRVALQHYRMALRLQQEAGDSSFLPQIYNAMSVSYEVMGDVPRAIAALKRGLQVARDIHSTPFIQFLSANLGSTYSRHGHADLGIPLLESATQNLKSDSTRCVRMAQLANAYGHAKQYAKSLTPAAIAIAACQKVGDKEGSLRALNGRGHVFLALGEYEKALEDAHASLALTEEVRSQLVARDAYKQGFIEGTLDDYNIAIAALTALHRPVEALEAAEQARSRALLDLLGTHRAALEQQDTAPPQDAALLASTAQVQPANWADMRASLQRLHSTLLSYWTTPNTIYIWAVQPDGGIVQVTRHVSAAALVRAGNHVRLYRELIQPVRSHLPTGSGALLTIVPSGPLFQVSFPALRAPGGSYLVERYRSHTVPAMGMLHFTARNAAAAHSAREQYVFLADPADLPDSLPPLPSTRSEVRSIAQTLPPQSSTLLLGTAATRSHLAADASTATVMHLATHAVIHPEDSFQSFLALQRTGDDAGKLSAAEIYGWKLRARLVVLSACRSGTGRVSGDGVAGLGRAFFYAGAASVLTSLWDVADKPTSEMLPRLYRAMNRGQSPSEALQTAQVSMLRDLRAGRIQVRTLTGTATLPPDPRYWAGFSLEGEP